MDKIVVQPLTSQSLSRENFRKLKLNGTEHLQTNFIDGDFIEQFSALDQKKQTQIVN